MRPLAGHHKSFYGADPICFEFVATEWATGRDLSHLRIKALVICLFGVASFLEGKRLTVTFANTLDAGTAVGLVQNAALQGLSSSMEHKSCSTKRT